MTSEDDIENLKRRVWILETIVFGMAKLSNAGITYELRDEKINAELDLTDGTVRLK